LFHQGSPSSTGLTPRREVESVAKKRKGRGRGPVVVAKSSDTFEDESVQHIWSDVRGILLFALPALGSSLASPLLSAIDTAVIGQCATTVELAALGPSSTIFDSLGLIFAFLQVSSINKLAGLSGSAGGASDDEDSEEEEDERKLKRKKSVTEFILLSLVLGFVLMFGLLLGGDWLMRATTSQASVDALEPAVLYTRIRALSVPAFIMQITLQGILMGLSKDSVTPLLAVIISGLVNTLGDVLLVGVMGLGIAGAASATVLAQILAAAFLLTKIYREVYAVRRRIGPSLSSSKIIAEAKEEDRSVAVGLFELSLPSWSSMRLLLRESVPFLMMKVLTCVKVFFMNYLSTMFGSTALAAHLVALTIWRVFILVGEPLSYAAQSFAPQYFQKNGEEGEEGRGKDRAKGLYYVKIVLGIGALVSAAMWCITRLGFVPISKIFTQDPLIRSQLLLIPSQVILSVCIFPMLLAMEGSLLAMGRVRALAGCMASNVLFMAGSWLLLRDGTLKGVWCMFSAMHAFYASFMLVIVVQEFRRAGQTKTSE
jgi:Na+-driven multidrug efflux pump